MNKLITASELSKKYQLRYESVSKLLANIKPIHEVAQGRGFSRFYNLNEAEAAVKTHVEDIAKKHETKIANTAAIIEHSPASELNAGVAEKMVDMMLSIKEIASDVLVNTEQMDDDRAQVKKLLEQNVHIFKLLKSINDAVAEKNELRASIREAFQKSEPVNLIPPALPTAKQNLMRVVVVGLSSSHKTQIEREFASCFELVTYISESCKGRAYEYSIVQADHVLVMESSMNTGYIETKKLAAAKIIRISGGLSTMRNRLTELFVNNGVLGA